MAVGTVVKRTMRSSVPMVRFIGMLIVETVEVETVIAVIS